jgi:hypothetical protein
MYYNQALQRAHQRNELLHSPRSNNSDSTFSEFQLNLVGEVHSIEQNLNSTNTNKLKNIGNLVSSVFKLAAFKISNSCASKPKTVEGFVDSKYNEIILSLRNDANFLRVSGYSNQQIDIVLIDKAKVHVSNLKKEISDLFLNDLDHDATGANRE